jgi:hypothetical protein
VESVGFENVAILLVAIRAFVQLAAELPLDGRISGRIGVEPNADKIQ